MKRKSINKKTRFDVFNRDSFTCRYCGRKAPEVILEVDHLIPVSKGGTNDVYNLITSCRDCNRGKGNMEILDKAEDLEYEIDCSVDYYEAYLELETNFSLSYKQRNLIKSFFVKYGGYELSTAIDISLEKYFKGDMASFENMLSKIGGILYNRRKQENGTL